MGRPETAQNEGTKQHKNRAENVRTSLALTTATHMGLHSGLDVTWAWKIKARDNSTKIGAGNTLQVHLLFIS